MPTTGLFKVMLPVLPQKSCPNAKIPPSEATVRYPFCAAAGTGTPAERRAVPDEPGQGRVVVELRPPAGRVGIRRAGPRHLEVLDDALDGVPSDAEVAGDGDADLIVCIRRHERSVLEAIDLVDGDSAVAGAVIDVGHLLAVLAVEDVQTVVRGNDDILIAGTEVGCRH